MFDFIRFFQVVQPIYFRSFDPYTCFKVQLSLKKIIKDGNKTNTKENRKQDKKIEHKNHYEELKMAVRTMKIAVRAMNSKIEPKNKIKTIELQK